MMLPPPGSMGLTQVRYQANGRNVLHPRGLRERVASVITYGIDRRTRPHANHFRAFLTGGLNPIILEWTTVLHDTHSVFVSLVILIHGNSKNGLLALASFR
jgi:hypothetical protein